MAKVKTDAEWWLDVLDKTQYPVDVTHRINRKDNVVIHHISAAESVRLLSDNPTLFLTEFSWECIEEKSAFGDLELKFAQETTE